MTAPVDLGSQARPLWNWVTARVNGAPALPQSPNGNPLLRKPKRIYRGRVTDPDGPPGHFLIGIAPEVPGGFYNGLAGLRGRLTVHCWSDTLDNAERLFEWLKALLLDPAPTEIEGRQVIEFEIAKGSQSEDLSRVGWQVPMLIEVETLAA